MYTPGNGTPALGSGYGTPRTPGNHNNGGNGDNGGETGNEEVDMDRRLAHLERMLSGLTETVTGMAEQQKSQLNQSQGSNGNALGNPTGSIPKEKPRLRVRRSDLTEACQRIDAVDTSLNPSGEISHQRMVNNVEVEESENNSEALADVNVVRTRQARDNRYTARRREQPEQEGERENVFRQQPPQHQRTKRNQVNPNHQGQLQHNRSHGGNGEPSGVVKCWNCLEEGHERCVTRNYQFSGRNNQGN
ncbi:hypothetical protein pipiens_015268 [Culex pipiens pipiens]|uniref:Uncharacterized protein n=1 Tax=Culex pipiens pipiens TaxID=38569 RepID=A0ABD1CT41_CULPP